MDYLPKQGDRIWLVEMPDDPCPVEPGTTGTVRNQPVNVGGRAQISVEWDDGRSLNLCVPPDKWAYLYDRDRHICNLYQLFDLTLQQVADRVGLTRQRVQQILVARDIPRRTTGRRRALTTAS